MIAESKSIQWAVLALATIGALQTLIWLSEWLSYHI